MTRGLALLGLVRSYTERTGDVPRSVLVCRVQWRKILAELRDGGEHVAPGERVCLDGAPIEVAPNLRQGRILIRPRGRGTVTIIDGKA